MKSMVSRTGRLLRRWRREAPVQDRASSAQPAKFTQSSYLHQDAVGLAALIRAGELHPKEVLAAALDQIERFDTRINAIAWRRFDLAAQEAERTLPDSPVSGVPFLIKALSQRMDGAPHTMASQMRSGLVADHDSTLVARYKAAGLIIIGQTTSPEFGAAADTRSSLYGVTRNPWDLDRSPGGSSGGAAAAVAARYLPAAHASDGAGSIRIPASMCGLVGLKPTRGRTPKGPDAAEGWFGLSVEHAVTRTVRDSAALLDITQGADPGAPYYPPPPDRPYLEEVALPPGKLRIAVSTESMLSDRMDRRCVEAVERTAELLEQLGHRVAEARPSIDPQRFKEAIWVMIGADMACAIDAAAHSAGRRPKADLYEASSWLLGLFGRRLTAADFITSLQYIRNMGRSTAPFFDDYDIFVEPTIARPPWKSGALYPPMNQQLARAAIRIRGRGAALKAVSELGERSFRAVPNTALWNATGQPSISLPLHWSDGLPIGVQFTARYAEEALLFRLAAELEQARPWIDRLPPLLAQS